MSNPPLYVAITPHREFLPADTPDQKLFVMLKLRPTKAVAVQLPSTSFAFVIDTSGSMYEVVEGETKPTGRVYTEDGNDYEEVIGGKTNIDIVIESLLSLVGSNQLGGSDRIAIIQFDDQASTIVGLTPATQTIELEAGIEKLRNYSGGTCMGEGMEQTLTMLSGQTMTSRRALIFTDGQAFDEEECRELAKQFAENGIPITALGVGEYNEDLLINLSDTTAGHLHHIVSGDATGTDVAIRDLPQILFREFSQAQQEVINNLTLTAKTVKGVKLTRVVRAYPDQAEFPLIQYPYLIGTVIANDETVFILEFTIDSHSSSRVRIAQLGLTYDIPGQNRRGELPPQNVVVQFVAGQSGAAQVDPEVMGYVQQCNISQLVTQATRLADSNPEEAGKLLDTARRMTVRIGNQAMLDSLNQAQDELRKTRKISSGTRKTIKMGSRGKTIKMTGDINSDLSEEQIRNLSGT
ncbi:MAG: VWA domain-containing protein [Moorea sp. SIO1G6]|uniref:vWA domain-containing protein n=1 Tax=Moorena sp. SIO1G6 TaxID=2607840 RepID=UPI0013BED4DC|nr:VWA domain-containing protein [Moorena sp. SIO1G6]NET68581.1 VWA domain-containing protein [Moorena sp. SIO1G6]